MIESGWGIYADDYKYSPPFLFFPYGVAGATKPGSGGHWGKGCAARPPPFFFPFPLFPFFFFFPSIQAISSKRMARTRQDKQHRGNGPLLPSPFSHSPFPSFSNNIKAVLQATATQTIGSVVNGGLSRAPPFLPFSLFFLPWRKQEGHTAIGVPARLSLVTFPLFPFFFPPPRSYRDTELCRILQLSSATAVPQFLFFPPISPCFLYKISFS